MNLMDQFDGTIDEELDNIEFGLSGMPLSLEPAADEGHIYLALARVWGEVSVHPGSDEVKQGVAFTPPIGTELVVAFPRSEEKGALKKMAITFDELRRIVQTMMTNLREGIS